MLLLCDGLVAAAPLAAAGAANLIASFGVHV